jgi:hypothetical protein
MNWIKEKERTYHLGIAEGFKRAAVVCESEILSEDVEPMPKDKASADLRRTCEASMRIMAVKFRRMADEAAALATESEGPEHG